MSRYLKVLKQIDKRMTAKGYKLVSVGDGGESINSSAHTKTELYDWATQTDLASMTYVIPQDNSKRCTFYLVYGNSLSETIYDMGYNNEQAGADCEQVADEVADFYEDLKREYA
jgi:hypothetical protein